MQKIRHLLLSDFLLCCWLSGFGGLTRSSPVCNRMAGNSPGASVYWKWWFAMWDTTAGECPRARVWSKNFWSHWGFLVLFQYYLSQVLQAVIFWLACQLYIS